MKMIIALLLALAADVSAFGVPKTMLGSVAGLAGLPSNYASALWTRDGKCDNYCHDEIDYYARLTGTMGSKKETWTYLCSWPEGNCHGCEECRCLSDPELRYNRYMENGHDGVCTACPIDATCDGWTYYYDDAKIEALKAACPYESCQEWYCLNDVEQRYNRYMLNGVCTACPIDNSCDGSSTWSTSACPEACKNCKSDRTCDGSETVVDGRCQHFCSANGYCGAADVYKLGGTDCTPCRSACDDACKPGGTYTGPGDPAGCVEGYCDAYKPGGWYHYRCDPTNYYHHYALEECAKTCGICPGSSGNSRSSNASLSIIIPVVIAAVLLVAAVLYLVRKRRVAAATPDETPQLDTEVQIEG